MRRFLRNYGLAHIDRRDLKRLNRAAAELNAEASDTLDYQTLTFPISEN